MGQLQPIPAFDDNYIWLLSDGRTALVVDPGDAAVVIEALQRQQLRLAAILLTHHHADHTGGVAALQKQFQVPVYGPQDSPAARLITHPLQDGDRIAIGHWSFSILAVPGHTLDHIAFHCREEKLLFCGDTLFSAGCGRVFEGSYEQMFMSLTKLAALPADTQVCCAHEYTLSNLRFAISAEPDNLQIHSYLDQCEQLRSAGKPTLPSTIGLELSINPFLRCNNAVQFTERRERKNHF